MSEDKRAEDTLSVEGNADLPLARASMMWPAGSWSWAGCGVRAAGLTPLAIRRCRVLDLPDNWGRNKATERLHT
jgi:hypothetical protein